MAYTLNKKDKNENEILKEEEILFDNELESSDENDKQMSFDN